VYHNINYNIYRLHIVYACRHIDNNIRYKDYRVWTMGWVAIRRCLYYIGIIFLSFSSCDGDPIIMTHYNKQIFRNDQIAGGRLSRMSTAIGHDTIIIIIKYIIMLYQRLYAMEPWRGREEYFPRSCTKLNVLYVWR